MFTKIQKFIYWLRLFKQAYGPYKKGIIGITLLGFTNGILGGIGISAVIPLFSFITGDNETTPNTTTQIFQWLFRTFHLPYNPYAFLILLISLFIAKSFATYAANYLTARIAAAYEEKTRNRILEHTLRADWDHLRHQKTGYLERIIIDDVDNSTAILGYISSSILLGTSLAMYAIIALNISLQITIVTLALGAGLLLGLKPIFYQGRKYGEQLTSTNKDTAHFIIESILGAKAIKSLATEDETMFIGKQLFRRLRDIRVKKSIYNNLGNAFIEPIGLIFIAAIFTLSYQSANFQIAAFGAIIYLINKIFAFTNSIQTRFHSINEIIPFLVAMLDYENNAKKRKEERSGEAPFLFSKEIKFDKVSFSHADGQEIVHDLSLTIRKNEFIGIVGPSGAGKTTIVDLILRLFEPTTGKISLDGVPLVDLNLYQFRKHIGYVSQDNILLNDTIENNIRYYQSISDSDISRAIRMAHIEEFIQSLPEGLATSVGERGVQISAGQRQRIILARILARKPDILILDEATSALDNESEVAIQEAIAGLRHQVTVITIAHRLSTLKICDRIIAIDKGKIVEENSPEKLLNNPNSYFSKVSSMD